MFKLTLTEGDGDGMFVAIGEHYRSGNHISYEVTGVWRPSLGDGKIPVELQIVYSDPDWGIIELQGVFDPEENSLKGYGALTWEFVFKRDPDYVRFYPAPSVINARERWEFATTSVLDRIRRQAWSSKWILQKLQDGRRFIELTLKRVSGRVLNWDEVNELCTLSSGLYEADARLYASFVAIKLSKIPNFS